MGRKRKEALKKGLSHLNKHQNHRKASYNTGCRVPIHSSDSLGAGWGLKTCFSNQFPVVAMPLARGPHCADNKSGQRQERWSDDCNPTLFFLCDLHQATWPL